MTRWGAGSGSLAKPQNAHVTTSCAAAAGNGPPHFGQTRTRRGASMRRSYRISRTVGGGKSGRVARRSASATLAAAAPTRSGPRDTLPARRARRRRPGRYAAPPSPLRTLRHRPARRLRAERAPARPLDMRERARPSARTRTRRADRDRFRPSRPRLQQPRTPRPSRAPAAPPASCTRSPPSSTAAQALVVLARRLVRLRHHHRHGHRASPTPWRREDPACLVAAQPLPGGVGTDCAAADGLLAVVSAKAAQHGVEHVAFGRHQRPGDDQRLRSGGSRRRRKPARRTAGEHERRYGGERAGARGRRVPSIRRLCPS